MAILHALTVLSWMEMRSEDRPPPELWLNTEALNEHFERLESKYSTTTDVEVVGDEDLDQNELTRHLRR